MLYVITLTYIRPLSDIDAHLDSHREWLIEHGKAGRILVAGPLESGLGGLVLAACDGRADLDAMIAGDSFNIHSLVTYDVQAFRGALRASDFPGRWAADARAVVP